MNSSWFCRSGGPVWPSSGHWACSQYFGHALEGSEALPGAGPCALNCLTHMPGKLVLFIWKGKFLPLGPPLGWGLNVCRAQWLTFLNADCWRMENCLAFMTWSWGFHPAISTVFYGFYISATSCQRWPHKGVNSPESSSLSERPHKGWGAIMVAG